MIFDFDSSNSIDHHEMIVICLCFLTGFFYKSGFCKMVGNPMPVIS